MPCDSEQIELSQWEGERTISQTQTFYTLVHEYTHALLPSTEAVNKMNSSNLSQNCQTEKPESKCSGEKEEVEQPSAEPQNLTPSTVKSKNSRGEIPILLNTNRLRAQCDCSNFTLSCRVKPHHQLETILIREAQNSHFILCRAMLSKFFK